LSTLLKHILSRDMIVYN